MRRFLAAALVVGLCCFASVLQAAVYEWVDDKGVVNFTDNADKIPSKYMGKAKEKSPENSRITVTPSSTVDAPPVEKSGADGSFGGFSKGWWKSRFSELRDEKKSIENSLLVKKEELNTLRRKKVIYQRGSDRIAYNEQHEEIARDEARIKELEEKLLALDADAAKAGVPFEWRQ